MNAGSWNEWASTFEVGERRYLETTLERYANDMRTRIPPKSRRPVKTARWEFTSTLLTAVSAGSAADVRYLICVERTA